MVMYCMVDLLDINSELSFMIITFDAAYYYLPLLITTIHQLVLRIIIYYQLLLRVTTYYYSLQKHCLHTLSRSVLYSTIA